MQQGSDKEDQIKMLTKNTSKINKQSILPKKFNFAAYNIWQEEF